MLHQIGAGVLGPVFRAYQPDPGRLVAVKQFTLDLPPETAHRFVAALDKLIAADLTHLGIAAPLAAGLTHNAPYLALDFVAAESFDVVIRDYGPEPVAEALRIVTQLAAALDVAAAVNVFHGALHPRDVLVSPEDTRVTGLGVAQALEQVGVVPTVRRPYTSPERVAGAAWDRRADVFSLGTLAFEVLFGRRVAGTGTDAAAQATWVSGADTEELRAVFARALAEDPADRFDTAMGFAEALRDVLGDVAARAQKPPRGRRRRDTDPSPARVIPGRTGRVSLPLPVDGEQVVPPIVKRSEPAADAPAALTPEPPSVDPTETGGVSSQFETGGVAAAPEPPAVQVELPTDPDDHADDLGQDSEPRFAEAEAEPVPGSLPLWHDAEPEPAPERFSRVPIAGGAIDPDLHADAAHHDSFATAAMEESRSAVWPIALALVVGLAVGFAFGYGTGLRKLPGVTSQSARVEPTARAAPAPSPVAVAPAPESLPASGSPGNSTSLAAAAVLAPVVSGSDTPPTATSPAPSSAPSSATSPAPALAAPASSDTPAADDGSLIVRSIPAGARVTLDGRDVGVTPVTLGRLAPGPRVVRIALLGYVTAERRVRIRSAQPAQSIEVALAATRPVRTAAPPAAQERTTGTLTVESRPAGARVFVDGKRVGTTPLKATALPAGDHAVRLERQGFKPWLTTAKVSGGEATRVSGSLEQR